jgi:Tol biopolymer transport system component
VSKAGSISNDRQGLWRSVALTLLLIAAASAAGAVELISRADPLPDTNGDGFVSALSADGRWVAFHSSAPNLIPGQMDGNSFYDLFLRDRLTGTTTLVSHTAGSPTAASPIVLGFSSLDARLSADGRYLAFSSLATRLVPGVTDDNQDEDVFLYDRVTGTTTLISHASGDPSAPADGPSRGVRISADGNWVVFVSFAANLVAGQSRPGPLPSPTNVFLYDRRSGAITLLSHAAGAAGRESDDYSSAPEISADGSTIAFVSRATDLLPGLSNPATTYQIFLYARSSRSLTLVSHASGSPLAGSDGICDDPHISADGRWIAFTSRAQNLVAGQITNTQNNAFLYDRVSKQVRLASHRSASPVTTAGLDINFPGDRIALSGDGRYLAFVSAAPDVAPGQVTLAAGTHLFVYDRVAGTASLVSHDRDSAVTTPTQPGSRAPSLSADGRYIAYVSPATDLVPRQTDGAATFDVFLYDQTSRATVLVSHTRAGTAITANGASDFPLVSADGGVVAFASAATDLGAGQIDPNGFRDVFLYDRKSAEVTSITQCDPDLPAVTPFGPSVGAGLSADGRYALFLSQASGVVPGQVDSSFFSPSGGQTGTWDVFLRDRTTGKTTLLSRFKASPPTAAGGDLAVLSADGGFAAFRGQTGNDTSAAALMLYDRAADTLRLVNHAVSTASERSGALGGPPALSTDGRFVAYTCSGCRLVPGQHDGDNLTDVYLYDRLSDTHVLVSHASGEPLTSGGATSRTPWISADGNVVAFTSPTGNLVAGQSGQTGEHAFVFDRATGTTALIDHTAGSPATATGQLTALVGMSADGRWIVFTSDATDLVPGQVDTNQKHDLFLYDRLAGTSSLISHTGSSPVTAGNAETFLDFSGNHLSIISADGRWIVFHSFASDLAAGVSDTNGTLDVYLYDRLSGAASLVSSAAGAPSTAGALESQYPVISADGSRIAFQSRSPDLLPGQTGRIFRFYVQDRATGARTLFGALPGTPAVDFNLSPYLWMSADGRQIAFNSGAPLVDGDLNDHLDAYLYDAAAGPVTVPPCTLLAGALRSNVRQTLTVAGACGVPAGAQQAVLKLTVSQGTGKGNVQIYPGNVTSPSSGILRFNQGVTRSAGFTVPLGNGAVAVLPFVAGNGTVRVSLEVDGYVP